MGVFDGQIKRAAKSIKKKGQLVTVNRVSGTSFDPVLGKEAATPAPYTGYAVELNYTTFMKQGEAVQSGDKQLILEAVSKPAVGETITTASGTGLVIDVQTLQPNGQQIIHTIQLRF